MRVFLNIVLFLLISPCIFFSCTDDSQFPVYTTENIIVVIMDGPRYSETWGNNLHQYIPHLSNQLAKSGVINTQFYNNGPTYTLAGHTSITTGCYQEINYLQNEIPKYPSFFQYFNATYPDADAQSWIITSKDKLQLLGNCLNTEGKDKFLPETDCGISGLGTGYRTDSATYASAIQILHQNHPRLVLISFRDPDFSAHTGNWTDYLNGIKNTDEYIYRIWKFIQEEPFYIGRTALFVTNDHGRHLDGIQDGFISHGDTCDGCKHILLYAFGPDFKEGAITDNKRELIDISATIAELLQFNMKFGKGKIMYELFRE